MKYGLIHYNTPGDTLEEFLDYTAETGFDAVELFSSLAMREDVDDPL